MSSTGLYALQQSGHVLIIFEQRPQLLLEAIELPLVAGPSFDDALHRHFYYLDLVAQQLQFIVVEFSLPYVRVDWRFTELVIDEPSAPHLLTPALHVGPQLS